MLVYLDSEVGGGRVMLVYMDSGGGGGNVDG